MIGKNYSFNLNFLNICNINGIKFTEWFKLDLIHPSIKYCVKITNFEKHSIKTLYYNQAWTHVVVFFEFLVRWIALLYDLSWFTNIKHTMSRLNQLYICSTIFDTQLILDYFNICTEAIKNLYLIILKQTRPLSTTSTA